MGENKTDTRPFFKDDSLQHFAGAFSALTKISGLGLWKLNVATGEKIYSHQMQQMLGYTPGTFNSTANSSAAFVSAIYAGKRALLTQKLLSGQQASYVLEGQAICKNGTPLWVREQCVITQYNPNGTAAELTAIVSDISDTKTHEQQLAEETHYWETMAHMAGVAGWLYKVKTGYIEYNEDYENLLGYSAQIGTHKNILPADLIHPEHQANFNKTFQDYLASGSNKTVYFETPVKHSNGNYLWVMLKAQVVKRDADGMPEILRGGILNIDQRVRAEQKLHQLLAEKENYNQRLQQEVDAAIDSMEDSQRTSLAMFNGNPFVNLLYNDENKLIDCNPAAAEFFGYSSKEKLIEGFPGLLVSMLQGNGENDVNHTYLLNQITHVRAGNNVVLNVPVNLRGEEKNLYTILKRLPYKGAFVTVVYIVDVTGLHNANRELQENSALLSCINDVAAQLLTTDTKSFENTIYRCMESIGSLVNADRMYIWECYHEDGRPYGRQLYEWSGGAMPQQGNYDTTVLNFDTIPHWRDKISYGEIVNTTVSARSEKEQKYFAAQQIKSLMLIPIILQNKPWGFVGLDDCHEERIFTKKEESIMNSAANILVSGILRNNATHSLLQAREDALASTKAKSEFLSRMSHEMRTPMNAIIGMANVAQNTKNEQKIDYCLEKIELSSKQLLGIINDVLDMSKIDANKLEIVNAGFDFEKMLHEVFNVMQVKLEEKHQTFSFSFNRPFSHAIISDELRLNQVLMNLISNAVKFTPECGTIDTSIEITPQNNGCERLRVTVADTGIGIPEENMENLFNSFEQADGSITRQFGGTGLGLSICKNIISLMGGQIWAENNPEGGASFIFEIDIRWGAPLQNMRAAKTAANVPQTGGKHHENPNWQGKSILLVEDIEINREIIKSLLENTGLEIDYANDGVEGVEMYRKNYHKYKLVLMDVQMPRMDGIAATQWIRAMDVPTADNVPIFAMTANAFSEDVKACLNAGMNGHLAKPLDIQALMRILSQHLN